MENEKMDYIAGIRNQDSRVIDAIYRKYHPAICKLVEQHHGTRDDAHDVFQEGLMVLFEKCRKEDFTLSSRFLTYFYAVCRNIWFNKLRKKSNLRVTGDESSLLMLKEESIPRLEQDERYFLYRKKFAELGEDCQRVLRLFIRGVSMEKIMEQMGYSSVGYAKKRKFICKEKLKALIEKDPSFRELTDQ